LVHIFLGLSILSLPFGLFCNRLVYLSVRSSGTLAICDYPFYDSRDCDKSCKMKRSSRPTDCRGKEVAFPIWTPLVTEPGVSVTDDFQEEYKTGRFYAEEDSDVSKFNLHWDAA
jgi:hypothetical protein